MSYLVLARKWRPQTFADVVGQGPVVRTLQNAIKRNRVAHAMLFSGVRGVGKTTLARIMAKALNCEGKTDSPPCDQCDSCRDITAGNALDLHEIDGASNRGIQEIRELKENIRFFPTRSRFKIIIIDEVHMLTTEAFNALLKTLEEPPAHVYFMLATTELHKIPVTILSRCQRYELKRVPFAELAEFFKKISESEGVSISDTAIQMIVTEAEGSVRDGLSLLDQIFSFCGEQVADEDVRQVLGLVDRHIFPDLARALLAADLAASIEILDRAYGAGLDFKRFTKDLLEYFRALMVCSTTDQPEKLLDLPDQELLVLREIAGSSARETIFNIFHLLLKGTDEMQYSSHPRLVLETTFIKAAQSGQIVPVSDLLERVDRLLQMQPAGPVGREKADTSYGTAVKNVSTAMVKEPEAAGYQQPSPEKKPVTDKAAEKKTAAPETQSSEADPQPALQTHIKDVRKCWDDFIDYVKQRKQWMAHVLSLSSGIQHEGKDLLIKFDVASDCKVLQESDNMKLLTEFAQDFFQQELIVKLKTASKKNSDGNGDEDLSPQEERRALGNDPLVQMTTEVFGGQVSGIRTGPRSR